MLLAERRGDAKTAKLAVQQIEAAFTASRDGGGKSGQFAAGTKSATRRVRPAL